jgi:branched-chain amino acid transport system substrate-binding protein
MKVKKIIIFCVVLFFVLVGCKQTRDKQIILGGIMPLSGDAAAYGKNCKQGIELAIDEINSKGGIKGKAIRVIFEDSQLQPKIAVNAFQKLVTVNNVLAILGPLSSSNAMATAALANKYEIVSFSPGASTPKLTNAGPYIYRNWQSDALEAIEMANYVLSKGWKKLAILYVNNDFGISLKNYFINTIEKKGGTILLAESFEQGHTDFKTQITKIKNQSPDAIYLLSYPQQTPNIVNQLRSLEVNAKILGVAAMEDPSLIEISRENAEGIIYTIAKPPSDNDPIRNNFIQSYENKYGESPGLISDTGYDAVYILARAIENSNKLSRESIQKSLKEIKIHKGASGYMEFDDNGDVIKPIGIKIIKGGQFTWLKNEIKNNE